MNNLRGLDPESGFVSMEPQLDTDTVPTGDVTVTIVASFYHMTCYTCGHDLSDIEPITLTGSWDDDVLYITFECDCHTSYEIRLTPEVLRDVMEPLSCL